MMQFAEWITSFPLLSEAEKIIRRGGTRDPAP
jgi:hypothetical protein